MRATLGALLSSLIATAAAAQSFNIDFGSAATAPQASYAAVGLPGTWNAIDRLPAYQRQPLAGLDGQYNGVNIYMAGADALLQTDDASTASNDEALVDDMLISYNNPLDVCIWIENLLPGEYEVLTYAITPAEGGHQNRVRVDFGTPGPIWIGGAWPGIHQQGVTFARHRVTVTGNYIGLHSGQQQAMYQSGINGIQIEYLPPTSTEPPQAEAQGALGIRRIEPNPARGRQIFELSLGSSPAAHDLEIYDARGRIVWKRSLTGIAGASQHVEWDGRNLAGTMLPASVYFARLRSSGARGALPVKLIRIP